MKNQLIQDSKILKSATECGDIERVRSLLPYPSVLGEARWINVKLLHLACGQGHCELVRFYIKEVQLPVKAKDPYGLTSLHHAILGGHVTVVSLLFEEFHADPLVKNQSGSEAIRLASTHGSVEMLSLVLAQVSGPVP